MLLIKVKIFDVVDGSSIDHGLINHANHTLWKSEDAKARINILLHYNEKKLLALNKLQTSKEIWDRLKLVYEKSNPFKTVKKCEGLNPHTHK
jgi:hypothetical protein